MGYSMMTFCCYVAVVIYGLVCCVFRVLLPKKSEKCVCKSDRTVISQLLLSLILITCITLWFRPDNQSTVQKIR
jgi:hypothetical protein